MNDCLEPSAHPRDWHSGGHRPQRSARRTSRPPAARPLVRLSLLQAVEVSEVPVDWSLSSFHLFGDEVAVKKVAHLKDLRGTRWGELQLLGQEPQKLLLLRSHDPIAVD
jgi:hypothetical protein